MDLAPAVWKAGDVILDLYEVKGVLGAGGMGTVYKVLHRGWNLELAVKSPRPEILAQVGGAENFTTEAQVWVELGMHPHIVSCFYVRTLGGIPRVFAELIEGGSLKDWINERRLYAGGPEAALVRILDVAIQIAWGLDYAHSKGLIHQDMKPDNVLMTSDGTAKVTDFGLARARAVEGGRGNGEGPGTDATMRAGAAGGTQGYWAPEQARAIAKANAGFPEDRMPKMTRRADLWAWGVTVLDMFAGERSCRYGQTAGEVLETFLAADLRPEGLPAMPAGVVDLLRQCFRKAPDTRPHDMVRAARTLRAVYAEVAGKPYPREEPEAAKLLAHALNNRAVSLIDLGRKEEAEKALELALAADPANLHATYNQGLLLWRAGRMTDDVARDRVREAWKRAAPRWDGALLLAWIEIERGDEDPARAQVTVAEKLAGGNERAAAQIAAVASHLSRGSRCLRTLDGHRGWVNAVSLTPDGRLALSGSADDTLRVWEVATGRCLRMIKGNMSCECPVCLTSDGRFAVSADRKILRLWEVSTGRCLRRMAGHTDWVHAISLTPDGRLAVSGGSDNTLRVWDLAKGRCLRTLDGHTSCVNAVSLTPEGRVAVSGSSDKTLRVWDVGSGRCLGVLEGHTATVSSVGLTPDGRLAVSGSSDKTVRVWYLDWECIPHEPADWHEDARPFLTTFLCCHTPFVSLDPDHADCLVRRGRPAWTDADFQDLVLQLAYAGMGSLRPEGVRRALDEMAAAWKGPPPLTRRSRAAGVKSRRDGPRRSR